MFCVLLSLYDLVMVLLYDFFFFFFKQKTAYEMRISDWSSDVCSSDLVRCPCISRAGADHGRLADGGSGGQDRQLDRGAQELSRREGDLGDVSMSDLGFTHIALVVQDIERSIAFYADYADRKSTRLNSSH